MASPVQSSDYSHLVSSFREMLGDHLPESSSETLVVLHSAPLVQTAYNILRNLHYTLLADHFKMGDFPHFLSSRVSFIEGALISLATTIHHLFFAIVYSGIVVLTLGLSDSLARDCYHHWVNSYYSILSVGTSLASVATPHYGSYLSIGLFLYILRSIVGGYYKDIGPKKEKQFLATIKQFFNENYMIILNAARGHYVDSFDENEGPCLARFKEYLNKTQCLFYRQENPAQLSLLDVVNFYSRNLSDVKAFDSAIEAMILARKNALKTVGKEAVAEPANNSDFFPLVTSVRGVLSNRLKESSSRAMVLLHSSALIHTAYNTIRNIPYSFLSIGLNDVSHFLSSRVAFIEGALISLAGAVHHLFFAIVYTGIVLATFGLSETLSQDRDHHWVNAYYSFLSIVTAIASVVTPKYGSYLSAGLFYYILKSVQKDYEKEITNFEPQLRDDIKNLFNAHFDTIYNRAKGYYGASFSTQEGPSLKWLKEQINKAESIHPYADKPDQICLVNILDEFMRKFPYLKPEEIGHV